MQTIIYTILCICYGITLSYTIYLHYKFVHKTDFKFNFKINLKVILKRIITNKIFHHGIENLSTNDKVSNYDKYVILLIVYEPYIYKLKAITDDYLVFTSIIGNYNIKINKKEYNNNTTSKVHDTVIRLCDFNDYICYLRINRDVLNAKLSLANWERTSLDSMNRVLNDCNGGKYAYIGHWNYKELAKIDYYAKRAK